MTASCLAISVICACAVILACALPPYSLVYVGEIAFPYTDAFVILAAGIGGLGCGLLSFGILFLGEFLRIGGVLSLYSVSTYLILVLLSAFLAYCGWFGGWKKSALAVRITSFSLAEALILCFAAIFCVNYFSASAEETAFDMAYIL